MSRDAGQRDGGKNLIVDAGRRWVEPIFMDGRVFCKSALAAEQSLVGAPDAIAYFASLDVWPDLLDSSGQIAAGNEWLGQGHVDGAGADVGIDGIHGGGADAHENLAGAGLGPRQF